MCINKFPVTFTGIPFFKCQNVSEEEMPEPQKHLYQRIKVNDLAAEYDIPVKAVSTWKNTLINI